MNELIRESRPNLTDSSIRTYASVLKNLYGRIIEDAPMRPKPDVIKDFFCSHPDKVLAYLKNIDYAKRKTLLASLVALCGQDTNATKQYRQLMIQDADKYRAELKKQKKTNTQQDNWVSQDFVMNVYRQLEKDTKHLWMKPSLTPYETQRLMDFVILSVYTLIPPRRLVDYTAFKINNIDKDKDNYMDGSKFVFNTYKTKDKYGRQIVKIPQKLRTIISRWAKRHTNNHLLFTEKGTPMTPSRLTQKLNRIFGGKKISVNMLRHIFISDKVLDTVPALERLENVAQDMGHSVDTQMLYKKN